MGRSPRRGSRVLVQTRSPGHPAVQGLVRWEPEPFLRSEAEARSEAGFPPGHPVFRIEGTTDLPEALRAAGAETILVMDHEIGSLCLVTVHVDRLPAFRADVVRLATEAVATRIEAEPHL